MQVANPPESWYYDDRYDNEDDMFYDCNVPQWKEKMWDMCCDWMNTTSKYDPDLYPDGYTSALVRDAMPEFMDACEQHLQEEYMEWVEGYYWGQAYDEE